MVGDFMNKVFSDVKSKKKGSEVKEDLSDNTLIDETLSLKGLDLKLLDEAIETANSKRRMIGVWSPTIAAAMWYLKGTIPRFSISEVASHWIEEGLERDYPELVQRIREGLKK